MYSVQPDEKPHSSNVQTHPHQPGDDRKSSLHDNEFKPVEVSNSDEDTSSERTIGSVQAKVRLKTDTSIPSQSSIQHGENVKMEEKGRIHISYFCIIMLLI